jgi:hypothetical protein
MSENRDIIESIRTIALGDNAGVFEGTICKATDIDQITMTCTCTPIDGSALFYNVLLNANADKGFTLIPANNSFVVIQQTSQSTAYVTMVSKVDQVYIAGDINGGLVKVIPLATKIAALETFCNIVASALAIVPPPFTVITTQVDLENTTVKHGNG